MSDLLRINSLNIQNELLWLDKIIDVRTDLGLDYSDLLPFTGKLRFSINANVECSPINWVNEPTFNKIDRGVHLYADDCNTMLRNKEGFYAIALDSTPIVQIITQRDGFLQVNVHAYYCEQKGTGYTCHQPFGTLVSGWVKKEDTDMPDGYCDNITPDTFKVIVDQLPDHKKADGRKDLEGLSRRFLMKQIFRDKHLQSILPPDLKQDGSPYAGIILENDLGFYDRLLLILALAPHASPILLEDTLMRDGERKNKLSGGVKGTGSGVFLPTGQTFIFLSCLNDLQWRLKMTHWLLHESILVKAGVVSIQTVQKGEQYLSGAIIADEYYIQLLLTTRSHVPSPQAQLIS